MHQRDKAHRRGDVIRERPRGPVAPGNLDAMPHLQRRVSDNALLDEEGNTIPPAREAGRAGSDDVTWEAGQTMSQNGELEP